MNALPLFLGLFLTVLHGAAAQCTFCLPFCMQPSFPGNYCSDTVILSIKAKVRSNSTTVCTSVCDGKGIALGNLKTVYRVRVKRVFKGTPPVSKTLSIAGIFGFPNSGDPGRRGVRMDVGKVYFINLLVPRSNPAISTFPYVDRCDLPDLWSSLTKNQRKFLRRNGDNGQMDC